MTRSGRSRSTAASASGPFAAVPTRRKSERASIQCSVLARNGLALVDDEHIEAGG
jgi:hypothetical protein